MDLQAFLTELTKCPLIASVQASEGSPLEDPETLARLAQASASQGVRIIRAQGIENIRAIKEATGLPVIGLIKVGSGDDNVYITPTIDEVRSLIELGCEIIALDGTSRKRPRGERLENLIAEVHSADRLALADCDEQDSMAYAIQCGADMVSTTLCGYSANTPGRTGAALWLLQRAVREFNVPVIAEGMYRDPVEAQMALRIGAAGVVIGGALNDPLKQTQRFVKATVTKPGPVGAIDLGGTWLRYGVFSQWWELSSQDRIPTPQKREDRLEWIRGQIKNSGVNRVGISTGGTVIPWVRTVVQSKSIIPQHLGSSFDKLGVPSVVLNDGLATAWGHSCHPKTIGPRVATLALGTGIGCGLVVDGRLQMPINGQTLKLNDLPTPFGKTYEELLGGAALSENPTAEQMEDARNAAIHALLTLQAMCMPHIIVVCGGVGLAKWLDIEELAISHFDPHMATEPVQTHEKQDKKWQLSWLWPQIVRSPFGADAGLFGAAALALFPPVDFAEQLAAGDAVQRNHR